MCAVESELESDIEQTDALIEEITKRRVQDEIQNKFEVVLNLNLFVHFSLFSLSFSCARASLSFPLSLCSRIICHKM
jgi:hypothetical protein